MPRPPNRYQDFFDKIDTPDKAYILGLLYADGSNSGTVIPLSLAEPDQELLYKIRDVIDSSLKLQKIEPHGNSKKVQWRLCLYGKTLCKRLAELGCMPKKSLVLRFPRWLYEDLIRHFVRGYVDGDGSISSHQGQPRVSIVGTKSFCDSLSDIVKRTLSISLSCYAKNREDLWGIWDVQIYRKKSVMILLDWLYSRCHLYMERKYAKYLSAKKNLTEYELYQILELVKPILDSDVDMGVMRLLEEREYITIKDYQFFTGYSYTTAHRYLNDLVACGKLAREGTSYQYNYRVRKTT